LLNENNYEKNEVILKRQKYSTRFKNEDMDFMLSWTIGASQIIGMSPSQAFYAVHDTELKRAFTRSLGEVYRQGARGVARDMAICARPWGFRLEDIRLSVDVWQGEADTNVPPAMGRYLARTIPHARAHFFPAEGHFMVVNHIQEIFGTLLA